MATFAKKTFSATRYAAFRPTYPASLYSKVLEFHAGERDCLLDLGCGPGTATFELAQHFTHAIGTDPSANMVKQARESIPPGLSHIDFQQASAESIPLEDQTVDMAIAAQAAHWFDYQKLWPELKRVVKPKGTLAVWGYSDPFFVGNRRAAEILFHYAYNTDPDLLGSYWPGTGRQALRDHLQVLQPPAPEWEKVERIEYRPNPDGKAMGEGTLLMEASMTVAQCKDYFRTWSPYHGWQEKHEDAVPRSQGGRGDILDSMFDQIAKETGHYRDDHAAIDLEWGSVLILAKRVLDKSESR